MNFVEYLKEEREKSGFVLWNTRSKHAPLRHNEPFVTYAVSPEKALHQILHRLRTKEPARYLEDIKVNIEDYIVIPWAEYSLIKARRDAAKYPDTPPATGQPKKPQQMDMFRSNNAQGL